MIEGLVESLSEDGVVHGWVRALLRAAPCDVIILHGDMVVAEAIADRFRGDLLRGGHGHGHYGFAARLKRALPPGPCAIKMNLPLLGLTAGMGVLVPVLSPPARLSVENLLRAPPGWTTQDVLAMPGCLNAEGNLARMGPARFIDSVYHFVLGRWPSEPEAQMQAAALIAGRVGATALLVELLASRERADLPPGLISPFDPAFPFVLG